MNLDHEFQDGEINYKPKCILKKLIDIKEIKTDRLRNPNSYVALSYCTFTILF